MGITSCTISGVNYLVNATPWQPFIASDILEVPGALTVTIEDPAGTANFTRGEQVHLIDSIDGVKYSGYVLSSRPSKLSPGSTSTYIEHTITCTDKTYPLTKIANTTNYEEWYAGDIATDMVVNGSLAGEGITVAANLHHDTTDADFNRGILSGTIGDLNDSGDGCLELAKAGSDLSISENTTALFATGTLTNVIAANNTLAPTTLSGIKVVATLPFDQPDADQKMNFWSGSKALGTNDTLNFTIFISSTSPQIMCSVGLLFNDGTHTTGITDQNGFAIDESTDLSTSAKDTWYTRAISTSAYNGKTISKVYVSFGGSSQGTYTVYVQNVYLTSSPGSPFFSTTATSTQVNPMAVQGTPIGYASTSIISSVVQVVNPSTSMRISPAYSIDSVKLLGSSSMSWTSGGSGVATIYASYNGGTTYVQCTNTAPLPALPAGSNVAGLTLTLKEQFTVGTDPTTVPFLSNLTISLVSAPSATKSDVVKSFATQSDWNTGTYTNALSLSNGDLTVSGISGGWNSGQINNQTFFQSDATKSSQSVSSGTYSVTINVDSAANQSAISRLDWMGTVTNSAFIFDIDCSFPTTFNFSSNGIIQYFQTFWTTTANVTGTGAYTLRMGQNGIQNNMTIWKGTNSSTNTATQIAQTTASPPTHVKISVQSGVHNIYFDHSTAPTFTFTDTTYTSGKVGIGGFTFFQNPNGGGPGVFSYRNPAYSPSPTETWVGPSTSISGLGTCGDSVITWTEANTGTDSAVFVQSSVDGGGTYQTCTNGGAIPSLPSGTNVSGLSVKLSISFFCASGIVYLPILRQLTWRVLGQYPGSSGTRSTKPLGIDYVDRANQSGFGTASNGQVWAKTGTGTDAVNTNKLTITNTTGDVHERAGTRTGSDLDGTVQLSLSASSETGGMELRYIDANNYYRLSASTTALSIIKKSNGVITTLKTVSVTLATGTLYYLRFRVTGFAPTSLYGRVWAAGMLEPTTWTATATD